MAIYTPFFVPWSNIIAGPISGAGQPATRTQKLTKLLKITKIRLFPVEYPLRYFASRRVTLEYPANHAIVSKVLCPVRVDTYRYSDP